MSNIISSLSLKQWQMEWQMDFMRKTVDINNPQVTIQRSSSPTFRIVLGNMIL